MYSYSKIYNRSSAITCFMLSIFISISLLYLWQIGYICLAISEGIPLYTDKTLPIIISGVTCIISHYLLSEPIRMGQKLWYCRFDYANNDSRLFFVPFQESKTYGRILLFGIAKRVYLLYSFILAFLPFIVTVSVFIYLLYADSRLDVWGLIAFIISVITFFLSLCFFVSRALNLFLFDYVMLNNRKLSIKSCIKLSKVLIYGKKSVIIKVYLSFWWVYLLWLTVVLGIYFTPTLKLALADAANRIIFVEERDQYLQGVTKKSKKFKINLRRQFWR